MAEDKKANVEEVEHALEGHCVGQQAHLKHRYIERVSQSALSSKNYLYGNVYKHKGSPGKGY